MSTNSTEVANRVDPAEAIDCIRLHPADILRRDPGKWGRIGEHTTANGAASRASRVRMAGPGAAPYQPRGAFETHWQPEGDYFVVYARYVGEGGAR